MIKITRRQQAQLQEMPAERAEWPVQPFNTVTPIPVKVETQSPRKCPSRPFTAICAKRDYRSMYRAACDFHERNNPPVIDLAYWGSHAPGIDETPQAENNYWEAAAREMEQISRTFDNDPFLDSLLLSVWDELEREYKAAKQAAAEKCS